MVFYNNENWPNSTKNTNVGSKLYPIPNKPSQNGQSSFKKLCQSGKIWPNRVPLNFPFIYHHWVIVTDQLPRENMAVRLEHTLSRKYIDNISSIRGTGICHWQGELADKLSASSPSSYYYDNQGLNARIFLFFARY